VLDSLQLAIAQAGIADETQILVIDDGSSDDSAEVARVRGVEVERHPQNRGKGAALKLGLRRAQERGVPLMVTLDADGQHPPHEAVRLFQSDAPEASFVVGTRDLTRAGAPRANQLSNAFSNRVLSLFAGQTLLDTQTGLRRYPVQATLGLNSPADGFAFEADVLLRAARRGYQIVHILAEVLYPETRTSHFKKVLDPIRIVSTVVRTALTVRSPRGGKSKLLSGAPLIIGLTPAGQPPPLLEAFISACSEAAEPRICAYATPNERPQVEVSWQDDLSKASIRATDSASSAGSEARTISFSAQDPESERFRAAGYAVGTWLALERSPGADTATPAPPLVEPPAAPLAAPLEPDSQRPVKQAQPQGPPLALLDVAAGIGTGYDGGIRVGPEIGLVFLKLLGPVDLAFRGSADYVPPTALSGSHVSGYFWTVGVYAGASTTQGPWTISAEAGPFLEGMGLGGPGLYSSTHLVGGGRAFFATRYAITRGFLLLGGVEMGLRTGTTTVTIDGQNALSLPPLFATARLGISVAFNPKANRTKDASR